MIEQQAARVSPARAGPSTSLGDPRKQPARVLGHGPVKLQNVAVPKPLRNGKSGSIMTQRWSKGDSNPWSHRVLGRSDRMAGPTTPTSTAARPRRRRSRRRTRAYWVHSWLSSVPIAKDFSGQHQGLLVGDSKAKELQQEAQLLFLYAAATTRYAYRRHLGGDLGWTSGAVARR